MFGLSRLFGREKRHYMAFQVYYNLIPYGGFQNDGIIQKRAIVSLIGEEDGPQSKCNKSPRIKKLLAKRECIVGGGESLDEAIERIQDMEVSRLKPILIDGERVVLLREVA